LDLEIRKITGEYFDLSGRKMQRKYIDFSSDLEENLKQSFCNGLKAISFVTEEKIHLKEAMFCVYCSIYPFESIDYHFGSFVMKQFIENKEIIEDFHKDMSLVISYKENINKLQSLNLKTTMTFEGALFVLIALARSDCALGKKIVKEIMEENNFNFKQYGKKGSIIDYIEECKKNNFEIIKSLRY